MNVLQRAEWRIYKEIKRLKLKIGMRPLFHPTVMASLFTMICDYRF